MMRALRYFFDEAVASLRRGFRTAVVAMITIGVAFFVLGGFLLVTANLQRLFSRWQEAAEFSVYLHDDSATGAAERRASIEKTLRDSGLVRALEVISKEEALRRFKQNFSALADTMGDIDANPLPASIEVRLAPNADPAQVQTLATKVATLPGVADVRYDRQWIQRLMNAAALVRAGGFALAAVLVFAAALTVASVVRLALLARNEEIHIMQLVGAPLGYIRGPFIIEGLIQGGVGAVLALAVLWVTFLLTRTRAGSMLPATVDLVFLSLPATAALLAGGMIVGCMGGLIAAQSTREVVD